MDALDSDRPIVVTVFGRTHEGRKRPENQDSFLVIDLEPAPGNAYILETGNRDSGSVGRFPLGPKGALLVVADGMGGAAAGGLASELAVETIRRTVEEGSANGPPRDPDDFAQGLRRAVEVANARIYRRAGSDHGLLGMGTTLTAVGLLDSHVYLAQVGDSRAYLLRGGRARQLTRDQSIVQELIDAGQLTEEEAELSPQRNMLLQALGTEPDVDVVLTHHELRRGDRVVACSDGLSGLVKGEEIARVVLEADDVRDACDQLVDLANQRGGTDNITVLVAHVDGEGLPTRTGPHE